MLAFRASAASAFVPVVEPFDPGHPARTGSALASCDAEDGETEIGEQYGHILNTLTPAERWQSASANLSQLERLG